jgi:hypothetical protein
MWKYPLCTGSGANSSPVNDSITPSPLPPPSTLPLLPLLLQFTHQGPALDGHLSGGKISSISKISQAAHVFDIVHADGAGAGYGTGIQLAPVVARAVSWGGREKIVFFQGFPRGRFPRGRT